MAFLSVLDKRELQPYTCYQNPLAPNFGEVQTYRVENAEIHESRLLIFQGTRTSKRRRTQNNGWSYSILQRLYDVMRQFNLSWQSTAHLMTDSAQAVFKLKGLHAQIAANKTSDILQRMELVDMSRSVARAVLLDAEDEDFKRDTYSFSGVPEVLDKFMLRLAAAAQAKIIVAELETFRSILPLEFIDLAEGRLSDRALSNPQDLMKQFIRIIESDSILKMACEHLVSSFRGFALKLEPYFANWSGATNRQGDVLWHFERLSSELLYFSNVAKAHLHLHEITEIDQRRDENLTYHILRLLFGRISPTYGEVVYASADFEMSTLQHLKGFLEVVSGAISSPIAQPLRSMSSLTAIRESFRVTTVQPQQGWYRENDLQEALTLRLDEQNLINRADLVVLAAIGGIEDGQQIFTHLQDEARRNIAVGARTILLPYNVNNAHWIGIVIQIPQDTMERVRVEI